MKHISKKLWSVLLALALVLSIVPPMTMTALADGNSDYTLVIPSTLTVNNIGWNAATSNLSVTALTSGKKLTVTASSANGWALKSGSNSVSYTMKATSEGSEKTSWEFTTTGSATLGIDVADYSSKPAGTYQDTVTFTAKVESAVIPGSGFTASFDSYTDGEFSWEDF